MPRHQMLRILLRIIGFAHRFNLGRLKSYLVILIEA